MDLETRDFARKETPLAELVKVLAEQLGILWEDAGGATDRRDDIIGQMQLADQLGAGRWNPRLAVWVREVIVPRQGDGG
jgi:hypothetical protein